MGLNDLVPEEKKEKEYDEDGQGVSIVLFCLKGIVKGTGSICGNTWEYNILESSDISRDIREARCPECGCNFSRLFNKYKADEKVLRNKYDREAFIDLIDNNEDRVQDILYSKIKRYTDSKDGIRIEEEKSIITDRYDLTHNVLGRPDMTISISKGDIEYKIYIECKGGMNSKLSTGKMQKAIGQCCMYRYNNMCEVSIAVPKFWIDKRLKHTCSRENISLISVDKWRYIRMENIQSRLLNEIITGVNQ